MTRITVAVLLACFAFGALGERYFEVTNQCDFDVWVGAVADTGANPGIFPQFWNDDGHLAPGANGKITIPADTWNSARIWGRTGCDFSLPSSYKCKTGDCNGQKLCHSVQNPGGSGGLSPVTLAEFTLCTPDSPFPQSRAVSDTYDVSNVDGFNLPVTIHPLGSYGASPYTDPQYPFLNCGLAGECFAGMTGWRSKMLEDGCPAHNRVYGTCIDNKCDDGATCIGSTALCVANSSSASAKVHGCASDCYLSSLPTGARNGAPEASGWPSYEKTKEYSCPNPPYLTVNCPANYHLPAVGVSPFKDWPEWFSKACPRGSYGFAYDDAQNTYGCATYGPGRSKAYAITFCPSADVLKFVSNGAPKQAASADDKPVVMSGPSMIAQRKKEIRESKSDA